MDLEYEQADELRVVLIGTNMDSVRALATWIVSRWRADRLECLWAQRADERTRRRPVAINVTICHEAGGSELAQVDAFLVEGVCHPAGVPVLSHVAGPGHHALFNADAVIDIRCDIPHEERAQEYAFQMPFVCPGAVLVVHDEGASLADELDSSILLRAT